MRKLIVLVSALVVVASLAAAGTQAIPEQSTKLVATVGPGFTITLRNASGTLVTQLDPGTYEIEVTDLSAEHNFRLTGPGVNRATDVEGTGAETWTVALTDGTYRYQCDPHAAMMSGSLRVGNAPSTPPPAPAVKPVTPASKLRLTSGPAFTITLRTAAGKAVKSMRRGTYTVVVRDRSRIHNAHVVGPGYNRATKPLTFTGSQTWKMRLARTGTLRFLCDPHSATMKGSAKIVR